LFAVLALIVVIAIAAVGAFKATQHEPEFYRSALAAPSQEQEEAGDLLEKEVLDLRNDIQREGDWEAIFSDAQINGWLAADLPEKFPDALPSGVADPRVAISPKFVRVGCRYQSPKISTVLTLSLQVSLTDEPNVVAVRILGARAGLLPIPISEWLDEISEQARESDIELTWEQIDGDPVALVRVPMQHEEFNNRELAIESIELREGEVFLAGSTINPSSGATLNQTAAIGSEKPILQR